MGIDKKIIDKMASMPPLECAKIIQRAVSERIEKGDVELAAEIVRQFMIYQKK